MILFKYERFYEHTENRYFNDQKSQDSHIELLHELSQNKKDKRFVLT